MNLRAKYFQMNDLLAHSLGLPPQSQALSNWIQIKYGMITAHKGGKDLYAPSQSLFRIKDRYNQSLLMHDMEENELPSGVHQ
jgi:hypothetical protein